MLKGIGMAALAAEINRMKEAKQDYIAPAGKLAMHLREREEPAGKKTRVVKFPVLELYGVDKEFPVLHLAHQQIAGKLAIPGKYYDRMLNEQPDLLTLNVNAWLKRAAEGTGDKEQKYMVRTLDGYDRAFLSNRYKIVDNHHVIAAAMPALGRIPEAEVKTCAVTELRMHVQVVSKRMTAKIKKDDVVQCGVAISNSEVGCGSISVSALDWRCWCNNGAIAEQLIRAFHIGREQDNEDLFRDDTRRAIDQALLLKVRDMVDAAVDETKWKERVDRMRGLTEIEVKKDPQAAVEVLCNKLGTTDDESAGVLKALIKGADLSAWGMFNAVTAQAHTSKSYDRAVEIEQMGGKMLSMSRKEWGEVLEAVG